MAVPRSRRVSTAGGGSWRTTRQWEARQVARIAAGQRPCGRKPKTAVVAHAQEVAAARQVSEATR